jgi:uridine kinase
MYSVPKRFIGIVGGSCSGKTTLSKNLAEQYEDRLGFFSLDDMYIGHAALGGRVVTDWEDPALYRWDDTIKHLTDLKDGCPVTITANESPERREPQQLYIEPRPFMVVVGFLALHNPQVRELFDTTIYLDVPEDEIIQRRLGRAVPGNPWDAEAYVTGELIAGHRRLVLPQRELADYVVDGTLPSPVIADEVAEILEPGGAPVWY